MKIDTLYFSLLRDLTGRDREEIVLDEGSDVSTLLGVLYEQYPEFGSWDDSLLVAVNSEYADRDTALHDGDEVAVMPPVQGG